jgi:uncharacterized protein
MLIEKTFVMRAPPAQAWELLLDVPRVAGCLPGAAITQVVDDRHFKGSARVKVGPVQMVFAGEAALTEVDAAAHVAQMQTRGSDTKGRGNVQAQVTYRLVPEGSDTRVHIRMDLKLAGSVAQYGRAAGLLDEIAGQYVAEFAANLKQLTGEVTGAAATGTEAPAPASPATENSLLAAPAAASLTPLLWRAFKAWVKGWFGGAAKNRQGKHGDAG